MDSSVVFNLREIMNLEQERIAAERAAARDERERAVREEQAREREAAARADAEQRAEREAQAEQVRAQEAAEQRARAQREESLLRIRLDAEARERLERERIAGEQARSVQALAAQRTRKSALTVLLSVLCAGAICGAAYLALAPSLHDAIQQKSVLARQAAERAAEIDALRRQLNQLTAATARPAGTAASRTPATPLIPSPSLVNAPPPHRAAARASHAAASSTHGTTEEAERDVLRDLDVTDSDYDPLTGIGDSISGVRKR
jgi:colicin import membrane protein